MRVAAAVAALLFAGPAALLFAGPAAAQQPFAIHVVDDAGEAAACARLKTVYDVVLQADRNGTIAFHEPGLMDQEVWFQTLGPPYELPDDWLGFPGVRLQVEPGGEATVEVQRTGTAPACTSEAQTILVRDGLPGPQGTFGVTVLDPSTARGVPMIELHSGDRRWVTDNAGRVAIFDPDVLETTAEVRVVAHGYTGEPSTIHFEPGGRLQLEVRRLLPAERLYRLTGVGMYRDSDLLGFAAPLAEPLLNAQVAGLDSSHSAVHDGRVFWLWGDTLRPSYPLGHFRTTAATSLLPADGGLAPDVGVDLTYFANEDGFARPVADFVDQDLVWTSGLVSVPDADGPGTAAALIGSWVNIGGDWSRHDAGLARWNDATENFEPFVAWGAETLSVEPTGTAFVEGDHLWFTDVHGDPSAFRAVRVPASMAALADPDSYEDLTPPDTANRLQDMFGTTEVGDHIGSVFWNDHIGRYLRISARPFGDDAFLGETWMAWGDTPMGPWAWARKVVTHDDYSFYNPRHHPQFDEDGGRIVYFDGTYSATFSGTDAPTPRYDYNPVMYRLDLDAAPVPVPVYGGDLRTRAHPAAAVDEPPRFFALDRPMEGSVALRWVGECGERVLTTEGDGPPAFHAMAAEGPALVPLRAESTPSGMRYGPERPFGDTIAWVWPNPIDAVFPVFDHHPPEPLPPGAAGECDDGGCGGCAHGSAATPGLLLLLPLLVRRRP